MDQNQTTLTTSSMSSDLRTIDLIKRQLKSNHGLVSRSSFDRILQILKEKNRLAADTETFGLRPYHGDFLFSVIIAARFGEQVGAQYFNFLPYEGLDEEYILGPEHLQGLQGLFSDKQKYWFLHNAKFDGHVLAASAGLNIEGCIHDTLSIARVEKHDRNAYDLGALLGATTNVKKDETVDNYIDEHKLYTTVQIPGKKKKEKNKHFNKVPPEIIIPYGCDDAIGTFILGEGQLESIAKQSATQKGARTLNTVLSQEIRLTQAVFRMEQRGVLIDREYTQRALRWEEDRILKLQSQFLRESGRTYKDSSKLFAEVFSSEHAIFSFTDKGAASFDYDSFTRFKNPLAKIVLEIRDAESRKNFYGGYLYYADASGILHPNFNNGGTRTGRSSSSNPNFQNLTNEEGQEELEFIVRRAIIPRPGYCFFMPDYDQMEYKMMFDYAVRLIQDQRKKEGLPPFPDSYFALVFKVRDQKYDVHQATLETILARFPHLSWLTRSKTKNINFGLLYGQGAALLAQILGISVEDAKALKRAYFDAIPYIEQLIQILQNTAKERGWVQNWMGRIYHLDNHNFAYRIPNYMIQGGSADAFKKALIGVDDYLLDKKSKMVLQIHDEIPTEIHESELDTVPRKITEIMESVYPHFVLPLTAGAEFSWKSLGDKKKGYPTRE